MTTMTMVKIDGHNGSTQGHISAKADGWTTQNNNDYIDDQDMIPTEENKPLVMKKFFE